MQVLSREEIMAMPPKWYIVYTYPGYENIVKDSLEKVIEKNALQERILEIAIPMEDVVEERNGKRKVVQRKKFPCYVMLKMRYTNDMWHLITDTRGVTSFVGPLGRPQALTEAEIKRMKLEKSVAEVNLKVGDKIKVIDGPLEGFVGSVNSVDAAAVKCKVDVSMFGRITPVELELSQVAKLEES